MPLEKLDSYLRTRMNDTLQSFARDWNEYATEATALLIQNGFPLTAQTLKEAHELKTKWEKEENAIAEKRTKEAEEQRMQNQMPDSKIPKMLRYNQRETQPDIYFGYLKTCDKANLEPYLADLKARPTHYQSIYPHGKLNEVINDIETALEQRKNEPTPKTTPETSKKTKDSTRDYSR